MSSIEELRDAFRTQTNIHDETLLLLAINHLRKKKPIVDVRLDSKYPYRAS